MNKERRKQMNIVCDFIEAQVEDLNCYIGEEEDYLNNIPESMKEKRGNVEVAFDSLEYNVGTILFALNEIREAIQE